MSDEHGEMGPFGLRDMGLKKGLVLADDLRRKLDEIRQKVAHFVGVARALICS
jgi:hypothetical protein